MISFVATAVVAATFAVPIALSANTTGDEYSMSPVGWVALVLGYFVAAYVIIFFNTALVCAAQDFFEGGEPTVGSALSAAAGRAGRILPWAVVSATVTLALRAAEERFGILGQIAVSLVGLAWGLVTFLVLPIVALEDIGIGAAIKRSAKLFKQTWGENVIANGAIGLILGFLAMLCGLPLLLLLFTGSAVAVVAGITLFVLWVAVVAVVVSSMTVVLQTALYRYATGLGTPEAYGDVDFAHAFTQRGRRAATA